MTTITETSHFKPSPLAWEAFQAFSPRTAGAAQQSLCNLAATKLLYHPLEPGQRELLRYYATRINRAADALTPRAVPLHPWDEEHRRDILHHHAETLRCLMAALLIPHHINPNAIAPADYPSLAAIALGNVDVTIEEGTQS